VGLSGTEDGVANFGDIFELKSTNIPDSDEDFFSQVVQTLKSFGVFAFTADSLPFGYE
jgi:hypothetical protein